MAKHYESDVTQFIKQFKQDHPKAEEGQRQGRAIFWDKKIDTDLQEGYKAASIAQDPYVYYQK